MSIDLEEVHLPHIVTTKLVVFDNSNIVDIIMLMVRKHIVLLLFLQLHFFILSSVAGRCTACVYNMLFCAFDGSISNVM